MMKCEYTENGNAITCWEANVVPGYTITKLRANGTEERNLSAAITPEAGKFYDITLDKDKGYTVSEDGNTYEVYNAEGLKNIAKLVNEEWKLDINITLTDDIDLTGIDWTPISTFYNSYTGTFDGNGKTITGLTVTGSDQYAGLFGCIGSGGTVKNVVLEGVQITSDNSLGSGGGVAGYSYGNIEYCSVSGSVSGSSRVGGVVGFNYGSVTGCNASGDVTGTNASSYVGGVAGYNYGGTVTACTSSGSVSSDLYVGGVVGWNNGGTVTACTSSGDVTGMGNHVGGVVGYNNGGTVTACCHVSGSVEGSSHVGGVVGYNNIGSTVTACYWSDYAGNGIGTNYAGTGETTQVDGTDVTWQKAVAAMNAAIETWNTANPDKTCDWQYELTGALPTLKKQ